MIVESEVERKGWPTWLKWLVRIVLAYIILLAVILAITIIVILITFTLIVIDGLKDSTALGVYAEQYLVPISEFLWKLFTWLIPGL